MRLIEYFKAIPKIISSSKKPVLPRNDDRGQMLSIISDYANSLTRVSSEELFPHIANAIKTITRARASTVNTYDSKGMQLICRYTSLPKPNSKKLAKILGHNVVGTRVFVNEEFYNYLMDVRIAKFDSLHAATNGAISKPVSKMVDIYVGANCYIAITLFIGKSLVGSLLLAGEEEDMICSKELLMPFAALTANAIELKEAEKLVEEGYEWSRTIAEDIPVMVVRISPDFKFTYINDAYCAFMGKAVEKITGDKLSNYVPPENYSLVVNHFLSLTPIRPIDSHEHTNIKHDGSIRWIKWINRAIFDTENRVKEYLCIGEDITEQKNAFRLLKESEALKSSIIEASPDLIIRHDHEGYYLDILSGSDDLLYMPREKMIGKSIDEVLPSELAGMIRKSIKKAILTRELQTVEYTLDTPAGTYEFESRIKANGNQEVISFVREITEQKRFEKELRDSEEKYREILASIEEGYYEVDLSGNLTYCNDATLRILGYSREEFIGMNYRQIYRDPDKVFKNFNRVFLSGEPDRGFTLEMLRKDGNSLFGELSISLIRDRLGAVTGFRGVARDITERILFEKKLEYLSLHDQLTGLYNRSFFEEKMTRMSKGSNYPITIISVDVDDLKLVNDSLGHDAGDKILQEAAEILKKSIRSDDILARVGGDEFTVILPETDEKTGEVVASRIRKYLGLYNLDNEKFPLGLSIGLATASAPEYNLTDIFKKADDNMYHDKLSRSNRVRNKTVEALLAALAERDYITEGHAQRLSDYCMQIGEIINLSTRQLSDLSLLAQVHDLGKVGLPDNILCKNGSLTRDEWKTMRLHPEKGYRIAIASPDLSGIADLILKHHERWDGSGYPLGLREKEIPVECRILAIVDAYDAMTSDRPYSNAVSNQVALEEISRCSGSQFDPELTEIFISLFPDE